MARQIDENIHRRSLVAGMGAVVAGIAVSAGPAAAQSAPGFQPARHDEDAWFDQAGATHRVFVDSASPLGGADALRFTANILNAHSGNAYGGTDTDMAMIVCFRHASTAYGFDHALWAKYGEIFNQRMNTPDPTTGEAPSRNVLRDGNGITIETLLGRGVRFAICATATRGMASLVANATGQNADDVFAELQAGAIPASRFVPAGVMAVTRAQEYGYSLLYAG